MKYRINKLATYSELEDSFFIDTILYQVKIKKNKKTKEFFQKIFANPQVNLHRSKLWSLLEKVGFLTNCSVNSWIESLAYHQYTKNPSSEYQPLSVRDIKKVYRDIKQWLHDIFATIVKPNKAYMSPNILFSFDEKSHIDQVGSTRHTHSIANNRTKYDTKFFKNIIQHIFSYKSKWFLYWSGWWMYSIFPVVITKNDTIELYDKSYDSRYQISQKWVFNSLTSSLVTTNDNNRDSYDSFVILTADTKHVFAKYGNRGYRHFFIEAGAIGQMIRLFSAQYNFWYLELQWFLDDKVLACIKQANIDTTDLLVTHLIALW